MAEATDFNNKLFGTDRMLDALNEIDDNVHAEDVLDFMKLKIDEFIDGAPQFDDITMICLKYLNYLDKISEINMKIANYGIANVIPDSFTENYQINIVSEAQILVWNKFLTALRHFLCVVWQPFIAVFVRRF